MVSLVGVVASAVLCLAAQGNGVISGTVLSPGGQALGGAAVFAELGLGGEVLHTVTDGSGAYSFSGVPAGLIGVFSVAEGYGYGGQSIQTGIGSAETGVELRLAQGATLTGTVTDFKKAAVSGARIDRVLIIGESKFSVPLSRLGAWGYPPIVTGTSGAFSVPHLPANGSVALKVIHDSYAQEGVSDITVGSKPVEIQLAEGVRVYGNVVTRGDESAVSDAVIEFRNAQPPHDTSMARTDISGEFSLLLRPGAYGYRAIGSEYRSPAWERVTIDGNASSRRVRLVVARLGVIRGEVKDAATGQPIAGAKIRLVTAGSSAGVVTTGPSGVYEIDAARGINDILLEVAPGYESPARPGVRVTVEEDAPAVVPTFWLAPIPSLAANVVMPDGSAASGVLVRMLRPEHLGWSVTDYQGNLALHVTTIGSDGRVIGLAEHPGQALSAVFAVGKDRPMATVQLVPTGTVAGTVTGENGKGIEGATVSVFFTESADAEPLLLWRGISGDRGAFSWPGAPAQIPLRCVATAPTSKKADGEGESASGESATVLVTGGATENVGNIAIAGGVGQQTRIGKKLGWEDGILLCGPAPDETFKGRSGIVLYTSAGSALATAEALTTLMPYVERSGGYLVLVSDGAFSCPSPPFPVVQGKSPSIGKCFVVDGSGRVVEELDELPTLDVLRRFTGTPR